MGTACDEQVQRNRRRNARSREFPKGYILLLPQMPNLHSIIVPLLEEFGTLWCPALFPYHEAARWIHDSRYELPDIIRLKASIDTVRSDADARIDDLNREINAIRDTNGAYYTLLNGTGDALVQAVINALRKLGFREVIDVDKQARVTGEAGGLREDLQIRDGSPVLIVDVKGLTGCPEDSEATQSEKHALMCAGSSTATSSPSQS